MSSSGDAAEPRPQAVPGEPPTAAGEPPETGSGSSPEELIDLLQRDRLWLLRQIDSGQLSEWRLDLAALERELGQLLERASQRFGRG